MAIEVRPIHLEFVAEIDGIELGRPVDRAVVDKIWRAIDRYAVLVFHLDDERLRDFANHNGSAEFDAVDFGDKLRMKRSNRVSA